MIHNIWLIEINGKESKNNSIIAMASRAMASSKKKNHHSS